MDHDIYGWTTEMTAILSDLLLLSCFFLSTCLTFLYICAGFILIPHGMMLFSLVWSFFPIHFSTFAIHIYYAWLSLFSFLFMILPCFSPSLFVCICKFCQFVQFTIHFGSVETDSQEGK